MNIWNTRRDRRTDRPRPAGLDALHAGVVLAALLTTGLARAEQPGGIDVVSRSTVFEYHTADPYDRENLYGFNHAPSVVLMPDGRLLAAWFSGPFEGSVHQVILGTFSADGGRTWTEAEVLQDDPIRSDFDPAFIRTGDRLFMFYTTGRWNKYPSIRPEPGQKAATGADSFVIMCRTSDDSGRTWSEQQRVHDSTGWGCRSNGVQLADGALVLPTHDFLNWQSAALRSTDGGQTWTRSEPVKPESGGAAEPCIAQLPSDRLIMVVRSRDAVLRFSRSDDGGQTWSTPEPTDITAGDSSPNVITLADGRLLLTYTASAPPLRTSLAIRTSDDEGRTWSKPFELASIEPPDPEDTEWSRSVCYPSAAQLPNGRVVIVWARIEMSPTSQGGRIDSAIVRVQDR